MDHIVRNGATLGVLTSNIAEQQNIKYLDKRKDNHISKIQEVKRPYLRESEIMTIGAKCYKIKKAEC